MKRIFVTGASGFIGRHVIEPLQSRGFEVLTDRVDLMNPVAVAAVMQDMKPTHILHLAWYVEPGKFWTAPENLECEQASLNLYKVFAASGGKRFVGAGTCAEYDWSYPLSDEIGTPCNPKTLYGQVKDRLRQNLENQAKMDGVSFGWGRIFFLYGPHEKSGRLISDVISSLVTGQPMQTTDGSQIRDFMHVADVAAAFAALCDSDVQGAVNIASGQGRRLREILEKIGEITGRGDLIEFGARPLSPNDPPVLVAAAKRLQDEVGFRPHYDLDTGLKETVTWWQQNRE